MDINQALLCMSHVSGRVLGRAPARPSGLTSASTSHLCLPDTLCIAFASLLLHTLPKPCFKYLRGSDFPVHVSYTSFWYLKSVHLP